MWHLGLSWLFYHLLYLLWLLYVEYDAKDLDWISKLYDVSVIFFSAELIKEKVCKSVLKHLATSMIELIEIDQLNSKDFLVISHLLHEMISKKISREIFNIFIMIEVLLSSLNAPSQWQPCRRMKWTRIKANNRHCIWTYYVYMYTYLFQLACLFT